MKVLVIVSEAGRYGGTNRFLEQLLVIHARHGIVSKLLAPTDRCNPSLVSLAERYGVELVLASNWTKPESLPFMTILFDFLFSWRTVFSWRPDLIVVSTADPGRMSVVFYYPIPALYILHSMPEQKFCLLGQWHLYIGSMLRNRIMTVSNAAAKAISCFMGVDQLEIAVIHNSCRLVVSGKETTDVSIILTVGHLVDYKNPLLWLDIACSVLAKRPNTQFVWLGDGEFLEPLRNKVKESFLEDRIILPGYVEDVSSWYLRSSIYLQPSLKESHGIAVLEAMAHSLPCVVADIGGLPESVIDGENGYVCPLADPASFVTAITELLSDYGLRSKMGDASRQRAESCFSEEIQEEKILALYRSLVKYEGRNG